MRRAFWLSSGVIFLDEVVYVALFPLLPMYASELGLSYRLSTHLRVYAAVYAYEFDDEGSAAGSQQFDGEVWMLGTRVAL